MVERLECVRRYLFSTLKQDIKDEEMLKLFFYLPWTMVFMLYEPKEIL